MCTGGSEKALLGPKLAKHGRLANVPMRSKRIPNGPKTSTLHLISRCFLCQTLTTVSHSIDQSLLKKISSQCLTLLLMWCYHGRFKLLGLSYPAGVWLLISVRHITASCFFVSMHYGKILMESCFRFQSTFDAVKPRKAAESVKERKIKGSLRQAQFWCNLDRSAEGSRGKGDGPVGYCARW